MSWLMIILSAVIAYVVYTWWSRENFSTTSIVVPIVIGMVFVAAGLYITFKL